MPDTITIEIPVSELRQFAFALARETVHGFADHEGRPESLSAWFSGERERKVYLEAFYDGLEMEHYGKKDAEAFRILADFYLNQIAPRMTARDEEAILDRLVITLDDLAGAESIPENPKHQAAISRITGIPLDQIPPERGYLIGWGYRTDPYQQEEVREYWRERKRRKRRMKQSA